jgi:hypothetical protein
MGQQFAVMSFVLKCVIKILAYGNIDVRVQQNNFREGEF